MKRFNHLFPQVYAFGQLFRAAKKARQGNLHASSTQRFFFHLEKELLELQEELIAGNYQPGAYFYFTIRDPKERQISVAPFRDRVVHHAVVGVLEPIYERRFIHDSYACRKGKGTHRAVYQAQRYLRKNRWFFKTDIRKFFDSVVQYRLMEILERKIKDENLLDLLRKITFNGGANGKGLPIGNLTSQFFANIYLNELDWFVKQQLRCRHYIRYMDDFVLFSNDKDTLKSYRKRMKDFLWESLFLKLNESSTFFNQRLNGLSFLGARIFSNTIRIKRENLKRSLQKLSQKEKAFANGQIDQTALVDSATSITAHLSAYDTLQLRRKYFNLTNQGYGRYRR